jgi:hypothetical protein
VDKPSKTRPPSKSAKRPAKRYRAERDIQKDILAWLKVSGMLHTRVNSGGFFGSSGAFVQGAKAGWADIIVVVPPHGRLLGLEVKTEVGVLNDNQKRFKANLEAAGGIFRVVRSKAQAQYAVAEALGMEKL